MISTTVLVSYLLVLSVGVFLVDIARRSWIAFGHYMQDRWGRIIHLECFYCNETSALPGPTARINSSNIYGGGPREGAAVDAEKLRPTFDATGRVEKWFCRLCESWNIYDEDGSISSYIPEMRTGNSHNPRTSVAPSMPDKHSKATDHVFCQDCVRHQSLLLEAVSRYLPDDDDPNFDDRLAEYADHKRYLEKRYPPVCDVCARRVEVELKKQESRLKGILRSPSGSPQKPKDVDDDERVGKPTLHRSQAHPPSLGLLSRFGGGATLIGASLLGVTCLAYWTRVFYEGLWRGRVQSQLGIGLWNVTELRFIYIDMDGLHSTLDGRNLQAWVRWPSTGMADMFSNMLSGALSSCATSIPYNDSCDEVFLSHSTQMILQTAVVAFVFAETDAFLQEQRRTILKSRRRYFGTKGSPGAILVLIMDRLLGFITMAGKDRPHLSRITAAVYLCVTVMMFRRAVGVLQEFLVPRKHEHRRRRAGYVRDAGRSEPLLSKPVSQESARPSSGSPSFDRADSAVELFAEESESSGWSPTSQRSQHAPMRPGNIGRSSTPFNARKSSLFDLSELSLSMGTPSITQRVKEERENIPSPVAFGSSRSFGAFSLDTANKPRQPSHQSPRLQRNPFESVRGNSLTTPAPFVNQRTWPIKREVSPDASQHVLQPWSSWRTQQQQPANAFTQPKSWKNASQSNFQQNSGVFGSSSTRGLEQRRSPFAQSTFQQSQSFAAAPSTPAKRPLRFGERLPASYAPNKKTDDELSQISLSPQTFFPKDEDTGLEDLFTTTFRLKEDNIITHSLNASFNTNLNGRQRVAQRFLVIASPIGLLASWLVGLVQRGVRTLACNGSISPYCLRTPVLDEQTPTRAAQPLHSPGPASTKCSGYSGILPFYD
ncbi:Ima1 N-terminal domain-containing protein [Fimicolochytrium jonesii]|uniref:Ima1 N-terminal domain-containing protein n=1 Tax=Fimicolochytrium jonesii TaxID=1396493 RepID=UPI0022FF1B05|nr:Ima1 N-terminal domain-containing protein [Fimicolochytrium jonesii]KAI8823609.1 Ima1 N-terminal domain-containing protein [Fimicolochytrium jonesii]